MNKHRAGISKYEFMVSLGWPGRRLPKRVVRSTQTTVIGRRTVFSWKASVSKASASKASGELKEKYLIRAKRYSVTVVYW